LTATVNDVPSAIQDALSQFVCDANPVCVQTTPTKWLMTFSIVFTQLQNLVVVLTYARQREIPCVPLNQTFSFCQGTWSGINPIILLSAGGVVMV
jgi:hypothetical protein